MTLPIILASTSRIRQQLLGRAGVEFEVKPARVDEVSLQESLVEEDVGALDIAAALAEAKSLKVSRSNSNTLVIGCDQTLALGRNLLTKAADIDEARRILRQLSGQQHKLYSAAVISEGGRPIWRHVGQVRMKMRVLSEDYIDDYLERNWESVREAVGCYKLEEEGSRLFEAVDGDYFTVLGLPLLPLLSYLTMRGNLRT